MVYNIYGLLGAIILYTFKGPVVSFLGGALASSDSVSVVLIFILSFLGNIFGDLFWYGSSRLSRRFKWVKKLKDKISSNRLDKISDRIHDNPFKTVFLAKITPALPIPTLIYIGNTKAIKFETFMIYTTISSIIISIIYIALGYFSGNLFELIFENLGAISIIIPIILIPLGIYLMGRSKGEKDKIIK
ncbi:MAG: DedA family protein [Candidatus Woesearchaeota archaeon]